MRSGRENVLILAAMPWNSVYRDDPIEKRTYDTQEEINFCLQRCPYADTECCNCLGGGTHEKKGRPSVEEKIDVERLKEMLRLKVPQKKICEELRISRSSIYNYKKKFGVV